MKLQDLFTSPHQWCQKNMAQDAQGILIINVHSPLATSWCLLGGIYKCYQREDELEITGKIGKWLGFRYGRKRRIMDWNDAPETSFLMIRECIEALDI